MTIALPTDPSPRVSRRSMQALIFVLAAATASAGGARAQSPIQAPPGFLSRTIVGFGTGSYIGGLAVLSDGRLVLYDGKSVVLYQDDGSAPLVLFTPDDPTVFGTFLRVTPDAKSVYFGVNYPGASTGSHDIYRIPIAPVAPGTAQVLDTIRFNYDLAFDDQGRGFVSSLEAGSENRIYLLDQDPSTADDAVITGIPGASGPVAFHQGKLYYCTALFSFPPQPENKVLYFTSQDIEAGIGVGKEFTYQEALDRQQVLVDMAYGYFNFISIGERLLASNSRGSLDWIGAEGSIETFLPVSGSFLAFKPGDREFRSGAGPRGGTLYANFSDFSTFNDIVKLEPDLYFRRGRINVDPDLDLSDIIALLDYLFLAGPEPWPAEVAGDVNDDGDVDVSDPIFLVSYLYLAGPRPPEPFDVEGPDPTP